MERGRPWVAALLLAAILVGGGLRKPPQAVMGPGAVQTAAGRQLILDAGHGGEDGGAVSLTGVPESGINLSIVLKLDQLLGFCGQSPLLLRETDRSLHEPEAVTLRQKKVSDLKNRVAAVESTENALLISIHQNTYPDPADHGAQAFYRPDGESQALAQAIQQTLQTRLAPTNTRHTAKMPESIYFMNHITCPAVLLECGFLSNAAEEARLRSESYQLQLALCITGALQTAQLSPLQAPDTTAFSLHKALF